MSVVYLKYLKSFLVVILFYIMRIFPISKNKIVVCSYLGRGYGGEGKVIIDKIIDCGYDIVWLVRNEDEVLPPQVRKVKLMSIRSIYEQCTARVWIDNRRKLPYVRKRSEQYYIQVWHGDICIKYVEKDAEEQLSSSYVKGAKNDSKMANLFLSGTEWRTKNYRRAFWYEGEIAKGDLYRQYYSEKNKVKLESEVRRVFELDSDIRILLYAPTFRKNNNLDSYDIEYEKLLFTLKNKFGGKWVILIRLHPNIVSLSDKIEYSSCVINASRYPQINDLIVASEILITDFSGCMFDGYRAGKIVMIYASDLKTYLTNERGVYFDFSELPADLSENNEELCENIYKFNYENYNKKRKAFLNSVGYYDIDGADVVAERIMKVIQQ